jgi:arylsulfatase A-like enzyme
LISEALKKGGIYTAGFHSNPYMSAFFGWNRGWDVFYDSMQDDVEPMNPYIKGDVINQKVEAWLSSHVKGNDYSSFFLWVHYMDVHEPYTPDRAYLEQVDASIDMSKEDMFQLFKEVVLPRDTSNPDKVNLLRKLYYAHIREVDEYTAILFDILKRTGVLDETRVIITTDHGDEFNEHGGLSHDGKMYSELVCTPLMVYNLHGDDGVCEKLVSGLDISPTILSFFGLDPECNFQGQTLFPIEDYPEKGCYGEAIGKLSHKVKPTDKPVYYYREKDVKIIYREEEHKWELHDLQADPGELENIIGISLLSEEMKSKLRSRIGRKTF